MQCTFMRSEEQVDAIKRLEGGACEGGVAKNTTLPAEMVSVAIHCLGV